MHGFQILHKVQIRLRYLVEIRDRQVHFAVLVVDVEIKLGPFGLSFVLGQRQRRLTRISNLPAVPTSLWFVAPVRSRRLKDLVLVNLYLAVPRSITTFDKAEVELKDFDRLDFSQLRVV